MSSSLSAQTISTVVGNGVPGFAGDFGPASAAELNNVNSIFVDPIGLVYLSDALNQRIRQLKDFVTIITSAGDGIAGYSSDGILATTSELNQPGGVVADAHGNIYIGDYYNNRIRKVAFGTGIISTIGGTGAMGYGGDGGPATDAQLYWPYNVTMDTANRLYIADQYNHRCRMINLNSGIVSTVAGTGVAGYTGDGGPASLAQIYYPNYVHSDRAGNLYLTDNGNHVIRKISTSGIITTMAGNGTQGYSGDGGPATAAQLNFPGGAACDTFGNLFIADNSNNVIRMVDVTGKISTIAGNGLNGFAGDGGPAIDAEFNDPLDISTDYAGNIYVTDCLNNRIRKITRPATGFVAPKVELKMRVFPIPANTELHVEMPGNVVCQSVSILDISGSIVRNVLLSGTFANITIPIKGLANGAYILQINTDGKTMRSVFTVTGD